MGSELVEAASPKCVLSLSFCTLVGGVPSPSPRALDLSAPVPKRASDECLITPVFAASLYISPLSVAFASQVSLWVEKGSFWWCFFF